MKLNFLSADVPLAKSYKEIAPGNYKEESYPNVSLFTSIQRDIDSLSTLYNETVACGAEHLCLLKGKLDRPLLSESRAGHTSSSEETEWICLDVDYSVTGQSPSEFLDGLSIIFAGVSFIFQYSSGYRIKGDGGWRGHFFVLLDKPQSPQALKAWLLSLNLTSVILEPHIKLSASGGALIYPLDITTCQNDKLLYIAPPVCKNFEDPLKEDRFVLVQRDYERLRVDLSTVSAAANTELQKAKIKELRKKSHLPAKTFKVKQKNNVEVLTNPDPVTVTGLKEERDFVYMNLNGGDSWGYYFPANNPDVVYNFKGEPCLNLWDVSQDLHKEYNAPKKQEIIDSVVPFGFLWPEDDQYYRGLANPVTKELIWLKAVGSSAKLKAFLQSNGAVIPKPWIIEEWDITFDPTIDGYADFSKKAVNTYTPSEYMSSSSKVTTIPPSINKVLESVCVDEATKTYFINWLAHIFQTRKKTLTAWIFQGAQGTGKGVLFSRIIAPLFGHRYCHEMTMDRLDDDFNQYLEENIVLFIDEANISDSRNGDKLFNRIKNLITEPTQHIRAMRANSVQRNNYSNIILASNHDEIIPLDHSDRRFNVAPRQETPLPLEFEDIQQIEEDLSAFAGFLHHYEVDSSAANKVVMSTAREKLIELGKTTVDSFFFSVREGDLSYFTQYLNDSAKSDVESFRYHDFSGVVCKWLTEESPCNVSRDELRTCYQYLQNVTISATKFSRMCTKYNLEIKPVRINDKIVRGIQGVPWRLSDEERGQYEKELRSNVVQLKSKNDN